LGQDLGGGDEVFGGLGDSANSDLTVQSSNDIDTETETLKQRGGVIRGNCHHPFWVVYFIIRERGERGSLQSGKRECS